MRVSKFKITSTSGCNCLQLQPRVLGNFKFTYTSAGNLHTQVLANAIANLPIHGKYIPLTKTIKKS